MSQLFESLGRGMVGRISGAFQNSLVAEAFDIEELQQAINCLQENELVEAKDLFEKVLSKYEHCFEARLGLACSLHQLGNIRAAVDHLAIAHNARPQNAAVLFCLGLCHEWLGDTERGIRYYQDSIEVCPTLRNSNERLAAIYLHTGRIDLAIEHYKRLCELDPQQVDLHLTLANLMLESGDCKQAMQRYGHALGMLDDREEINSEALDAFEKAGLIGDAISNIHSLITYGGDSATLRMRLGDLYVRGGNNPAALVQYQTAVELSPDDIEAHVKVATVELRSARYEEAAKSFAYALELNDRTITGHVGLGVSQHALGFTEGALRSFENARCLEANSTLLFSEVARMEYRAEMAEKERAEIPITTWTEGNSAAPASNEAPDLRSMQLNRMRRAIQQNPADPDLQYRLGLLLKNRGQVEDSLAAFSKAVEINPAFMKARIMMGLGLFDLGQREEAVQAFKAALEVKPAELDAHYKLALLFSSAFHFEYALELQHHQLRGTPLEAAIEPCLSVAFQTLGLIDRARASRQLVRNLSSAENSSEILAK